MKQKNSENFQVIKMWNSLSPLYFPFMLLYAIFNHLSPYFNLYLSAEIVDEVAGVMNQNRIIKLVIITVIGNFLISAIGAIIQRGYEQAKFILDQKETVMFYRKTLSLDYIDLEDSQIRQKLWKMEQAGYVGYGKIGLQESVEGMINEGIELILSLCLFSEMIILLVSRKPDILLFLFLGIIILLVVLNVKCNFFVAEKVSAAANKASENMMEQNRVGMAMDCYNMGKDIRLYRQDKLIKKLQEDSQKLHIKSNKMLFSKKFRLETPLFILNCVLQTFIYLFVCFYVIQGIFSIGSIIKYVGFMKRFLKSIIKILQIKGRIQYNTPFIQEYLSYLNLPNRTADGTRSLNITQAKQWEFEFQDVSFRYSGSEEYALKHLTFTFKLGKRIAIVGENGSGKSTFIKLLCRMYDPTEGKILLNGVDIREYNYESYLSLFGMVFQDFKLFSFPLGQNVAASEIYDAKRAEVCLKEAGLENKIKQIPNFLETYLFKDFDENGIELSGGEAQKIAIARAFYKDSSVVILDEPTAALDPIAEYEVYSKLDQIPRSKSVIYISHRLSSCHFCDNIMVFHCGELVQTGTHNELLTDTTGKYHELWSLQAQHYIS